MKVLIINGSPRLNGNTTQVLNEMKKVLIEEELEVEIFQVGTKNIRGCIACNKCRECTFN